MAMSGGAIARAAGSSVRSSAEAANRAGFRIIFVCYATSFRQPKHIGHGVQTWLFSVSPAHGRQRAARKYHAVLGAMAEFDPLEGASQNNQVIAYDGAAAQRRKTDRAVRPHASVSAAAAHFAFL